MRLSLNEPPQGSATIAGIQLRTDEEVYSLVHFGAHGRVQTTDRDKLAYSHLDGRALLLYRESISDEDAGEVGFVNLPEQAFSDTPEDLATLQSLYNRITNKTAGTRVYWQPGSWLPPHHHISLSASETALIQKIITAASYLGDYPLQWEMTEY